MVLRFTVNEDCVGSSPTFPDKLLHGKYMKWWYLFLALLTAFAAVLLGGWKTIACIWMTFSSMLYLYKSLKSYRIELGKE